jgi:hypothetical protein
VCVWVLGERGGIGLDWEGGGGGGGKMGDPGSRTISHNTAHHNAARQTSKEQSN